MRDEGTLWTLLAQLDALTDADFKAYFQTVFWPNCTDAVMERLMELYPSDPAAGSPFGTGSLWATTPNFKRMAALVGDYSFEAQRRNLLAHYQGPAWNYVIDVEVPTAGLTELLGLDLGTLAHIPILGSLHGWDCFFYVFAGLPTTISKNSLYRQATILSFARELDPNQHGLDIPVWPRFTADGRETYNFNEGGPGLERDDYRWEAMEYINGHADSLMI